MDDIVKQAMAKWPNVPDCFGWLGLDMRGRWWMRDDRAQAAGAFAGGGIAARGSLLAHANLIEFIERNYGPDEEGRWCFQNGPQRVYVELEATPWVWRIAPDFAVSSHTGLAAGSVEACLVDREGRAYLRTALGLGMVHTLDMLHLSNAVELGCWQPKEVDAHSLALTHGFVLSPQASHNAA